METKPTSVEAWHELFRGDIVAHPVFVYAKGEKGKAVCGFSHRVMQILEAVGADYEVRNIFEDPALRPALVSFTNWPTVPQVFIGGEFVGGCDILTEMYESGELRRRLDAARAG